MLFLYSRDLSRKTETPALEINNSKFNGCGQNPCYDDVSSFYPILAVVFEKQNLNTGLVEYDKKS